MGVVLVLLAAVVLAAAVFWAGLVQRQVHLWFVPYLRQRRQRRLVAAGEGAQPIHVLFCFADHYEPYCAKAGKEQAHARVDRWLRDYPALADRFRDADGRPPQHSFFYPEEEYDADLLDRISALCSRGYGEIEVHLHHDDDTEEGLRGKLASFTQVLHERHGALPRVDGRPAFAFIHGNWALDNSRADGRWCGINNELIILREAGCYADYTLPSAPSDTQTRTINAIYYAKDDPQRPKSHDSGRLAAVGGTSWGDLLLIQGPLGLHWTHRKFGLWPRIENADMPDNDVPMHLRVARWVDAHVHVQGRPDWIFVKVHTHGCNDKYMAQLFDGAMRKMHEALQSQCNDGKRYALHYVTAREMYNLVKAAEAGMTGDPNAYRDYVLPPPQNRQRAIAA